MFFTYSNHYKFLYFLLFLFIVNCQLKESTNTHGILFLENRANKLIVNKSNKNDVIKIIGQPHTKSINNKNEWMYIERIFVKGKYHHLGKNILKANNILVLSFDKYGILNKKKLFNKDDIKKIAFSEGETTNDLTKKSFINSMFTSLREKMYRRK